MSVKLFQVLACFSAAVSVAMMAVGSHIVPGPQEQRLVALAAELQLYHSLSIFFVTLTLGFSVGPLALFATGILLFCGSLYGKAFGQWPSSLAPVGGLALILGWVLFGIALLRKKKTH